MSKPPLSSTKPPFGSPPAPRRFLSWGETGDDKAATTPIDTRRDAITVRIRTSAEDGGLLWLRGRSESTWGVPRDVAAPGVSSGALHSTRVTSRVRV